MDYVIVIMCFIISFQISVAIFLIKMVMRAIKQLNRTDFNQTKQILND